MDAIRNEIKELETLLNSGATSVTSDGETVHLDLSAIRKRLAELRAMLPGQRHTARRVFTLDLSKAFR